MLFKKDTSKKRCEEAISDAFNYLNTIERFHKYTNSDIKSTAEQARFEVEMAKQGLKMSLMHIDMLIGDSK